MRELQRDVVGARAAESQPSARPSGMSSPPTVAVGVGCFPAILTLRRKPAHPRSGAGLWQGELTATRCVSVIRDQRADEKLPVTPQSTIGQKYRELLLDSDRPQMESGFSMATPKSSTPAGP